MAIFVGPSPGAREKVAAVTFDLSDLMIYGDAAR
jgi:hypothetical protein